MQQSCGFQRFAMLACAVLAMCLVACARPDAEAGVSAGVARLQEAIDARDAGDIEALLAEDFIGNDGLDRQGARRLAAGVFLRYRDVAAVLGPVTVELRGDRDAIARFTVLATGGSGSALPERGQLYQVETGWRLVDGDWRLLSAEWTPAL